MDPIISICQFKISSDKEKNILKAKKYLIKSLDNGCDIVILPECFICEYSLDEFKKNSEEIDYQNIKSAFYMLKKISEEYPDSYIVSGSIIEKEVINVNEIKFYNTCFVFFNGEVLTKYRKVNLYHINMKEHSFSEGDVLSPGDGPRYFYSKFGKIGLGICYDIRFPDLAKFYQENDCKIIIYPGSFNRITGPKHWKILQQARALDNQLFVLSCSGACTFGSSFESYGKSFMISPWGDVINETELDREEIITSKLNLDLIDVTKRKLPIL